MGVADAGTPLGQRFAADEKLPVAVLAQSDGKIIGKAQGVEGKLKVAQVEKLLDAEMKQREAGVKEVMNAAKDAAKRGDKDAAIAQYKTVLDQKCLFPKQGKDAANELKKLGVAGVAPVPDAPNFDRALGARMEKALKDGLMAENMENYTGAEKLYAKARQMDPADPAPLRYLGELYRHQTGDWDKARVTFEAILAMPADPLSRAVALHGLGKMTIHDGEFLKGLHLMEDSANVFPLALTYRNLAVYWHSEGDRVKADIYTKKALALDPEEPFNVVFAAAFLAGNGGIAGEQALKVAARQRRPEVRVVQPRRDLRPARAARQGVGAPQASLLRVREVRRGAQQGNDGSARRRGVRVDREGSGVRLTHRGRRRQAADAAEQALIMMTNDPLFAPIPGTENRQLNGVQVDVARAGNGRVKRVIYQPGFRWSTHMKGTVGTDLCMHAHVGFIARGQIHVQFADGATMEFVAPQVVAIPPGHEGWVVGDEPAVLIEFDFEGETASRFGMAGPRQAK